VSKIMKIFYLCLVPLFLIVRVETVIGGCSVNASSIGFGAYDSFSNTPRDSSGSISVNCTSEVVKANVTMSASSISGTFNPRQMRGPGADRLDYNIFIDGSRTVIFGNGTGGSSLVDLKRPSGKPAPWNQNIRYYGRIFPGQDVSPGEYSDTLTVTVNW
jgi:spore coat protein U-like protein